MFVPFIDSLIGHQMMRSIRGYLFQLLLLSLFVAIVLVVSMPQMVSGFGHWLEGSEAGDRLVALVNLLGVLVTAGTILVTAHLALTKLAHERDENSKNRSLELKKEVLLEAVRGMSGQMAAVGQLGIVEVPIEEASQKFQASTEKISAAHAVASPLVVKLMRAATQQAGVSLTRLLPERSRLQNLFSDMSIASDFQAKGSSRTQALIEQRANAILRGADERELGILQRMIESSLEQSRSYGEDREQAYNALMAARIPFMRVVASEIATCEATLKAAVAAIRIDMSVDATSDAYLEASQLDTSSIVDAIDTVAKIVMEDLDPSPIA